MSFHLTLQLVSGRDSSLAAAGSVYFPFAALVVVRVYQRHRHVKACASTSSAFRIQIQERS